MSQFTVVAGVSRQSVKAQGAGGPVAGSVTVETFRALPLVADGTVVASGGLVAQIPLMGVEIQELEVRPNYPAPPTATNPVVLKGRPGGQAWTAYQAAGTQIVTNGGVDVFVNRTALLSGAPPAFLAAGFVNQVLASPTAYFNDGLPAELAGVTDVDVTVTYKKEGAGRSGVSGDTSLVVFLDDAQGGLDATLDALNRELQANDQRYQLGVDSSGTTLTATRCKLAGIGPEQVVWIRSSSIGNAAEQIPASISSNSAAHYRFHPCAFLRAGRGMHTRITAIAQNDVAITASGLPTDPAGSLQLQVVDRAPTHSKWLLVLDGELVVVTLAHPAASDLRTPLEIWEGVIVPAIDLTSVNTPLDIFDRDAAGPTFNKIGELMSLVHLEYARFIEPLDDSAAPISTLYVQTP